MRSPLPLRFAREASCICACPFRKTGAHPGSSPGQAFSGTCAGRGASLPRRGAPGICEVLPRCSPSLRGERSADRRRGLRDPRSRCQRPDTLAKRVWIPLRAGSAPLGAPPRRFREASPHTPRVALAIRVTGSFTRIVKQSSLRTSRSAREAGSRGAPSVRPASRTRRRRSCFLPTALSG